MCREDGGASNTGNCKGILGKTARDADGSGRLRNDDVAAGELGLVESLKTERSSKIFRPEDALGNALTDGVMHSARIGDGSGAKGKARVGISVDPCACKIAVLSLSFQAGQAEEGATSPGIALGSGLRKAR